jgi:hypothetical protein
MLLGRIARHVHRVDGLDRERRLLPLLVARLQEDDLDGHGDLLGPVLKT